MSQTLNHTIYKKIKNLQRSPDKTKKRWLIGSSVLIMFLIIGVWLIYLNFTLPTLKTTEAKTKPANENFLKIMDRGFKSIVEEISKGINMINGKLTGSLILVEKNLQNNNQFSFEFDEIQFLPVFIESVPPTPLP